ncbi:MAG: DHHW family protein [Ruminococcus sp.]|nr:DHHW family protein [Ruminococcus sp.]
MKTQKYLSVVLCSVFIVFFSFWCFFIPTPDYSESERRSLAKPPKVTWESVQSGDYAKKFEEYTTDRFPMRDTWRSIKAYTRLNLLLQKENNDIFVKDGHIAKLEYPMNTKMLDYAISLFTKLQEKHFQDNDVYFAVIPDKNEYLADLKIDFKELEKYVYDNMQFCTPIHLNQLLSADDYYFTDSHWKQEKIADVADYIAECMGTDIPDDYTQLKLDIPFSGVYAGQSALNFEPDTITYLTNDTIENLKVTGANAVYDIKKANGKDAYEFFLSGNQPLVKISNPKVNNGKKLVVFRDSFASSLMPLLAQGYSEITLVDLRYMNSMLLEQYVDFSDSQVLFLYSTNLLNNSTSMK